MPRSGRGPLERGETVPEGDTGFCPSAYSRAVWIGFPRHLRRGPIEAHWQPPPGVCSVRFRVIYDAAPLKPRSIDIHEGDQREFPRHLRRGPIEAWSS